MAGDAVGKRFEASRSGLRDVRVLFADQKSLNPLRCVEDVVSERPPPRAPAQRELRKSVTRGIVGGVGADTCIRGLRAPDQQIAVPSPGEFRQSFQERL